MVCFAIAAMQRPADRLVALVRAKWLVVRLIRFGAGFGRAVGGDAKVAQRPIWRGHLRLALVSSPVALYTAHHDSSDLHFHLINPKTENRIRMITQDAETEEPLSRRDLVKGYELKKEHYLIMTDEDFQSAPGRELVHYEYSEVCRGIVY